MLTIFSCPKPFDGHLNIIQRNAIKSWTLLKPKPEIVLIGDEKGYSDVCQEFGLRHIAEVARNEYGTPLVSSLFETGQLVASNPLACYVNADIIVMKDFVKSIQFIKTRKNPGFLLVGRRWDVSIKEPLRFGTGWESELINLVRKNGKLSPIDAIDYFVFNRGLYENVPPFALGRMGWDNWLIYYAVSKRIHVIDLTPDVMVVHQNHNYLHMVVKGHDIDKDPEVKYNRQLIEPMYPIKAYTLWNATHILQGGYIKKASIWRKVDFFVSEYNAYVKAKLQACYPFPWPVCIFLKVIKILFVGAIRVSRQRAFERDIIHNCGRKNE